VFNDTNFQKFVSIIFIILFFWHILFWDQYFQQLDKCLRKYCIQLTMGEYWGPQIETDMFDELSL